MACPPIGTCVSREATGGNETGVGTALPLWRARVLDVPASRPQAGVWMEAFKSHPPGDGYPAFVSKKVASDSGESISFEQSLAEVEAIIRRVESGEVGLEDSIVQYERGVALIRQCRETLDRAEQRVVDLTSQMNSQMQGQVPAKATPPSPPGRG